MKYPRPVHYYDHAFTPPRIACGRAVFSREQYTEDKERISCYECARQASDLTTEQRDNAWQNANERLGTFRRSPWEDQVKVKKSA